MSRPYILSTFIVSILQGEWWAGVPPPYMLSTFIVSILHECEQVSCPYILSTFIIFILQESEQVSCPYILSTFIIFILQESEKVSRSYILSTFIVSILQGEWWAAVQASHTPCLVCLLSHVCFIQLADETSGLGQFLNNGRLPDCWDG